jgi:hypothetical protein
MDEGENHFGLTYVKTGGAIGRQPDAKAFQVLIKRYCICWSRGISKGGW